MNKAISEQAYKAEGDRAPGTANTALARPALPLPCSLLGSRLEPQVTANTGNPAQSHRLTLTNELSFKVTPEVNHVKIIKGNNTNAYSSPQQFHSYPQVFLDSS